MVGTDKQEQIEGSSKDNLYIFSDIMAFVKASTGLSITLAYLVLILSSMAYLAIYFYSFDIHIIKFITLEDILATPIRNPDIILVFGVIAGFLCLSDLSNQFYARQRTNSNPKNAPIFLRILTTITWTPKNRKTNARMTFFITLFVLVSYIFLFASSEAADVKDGEGPFVEIKLADETESFQTSLLGLSTYFVFTYDHVKQESKIFQIESIKSLTPISQTAKLEDKNELPLEEAKENPTALELKEETPEIVKEEN